MGIHPTLRRQALLDHAAGLIDEVLAWEAAHPEAELIEIEAQLQALRQKFSQVLVNDLVHARAEAQSETPALCPACGERLQAKGEKAKTTQTLVGELKYRRGYYYCASCQQGVFPPGSSTESTGGCLE